MDHFKWEKIWSWWLEEDMPNGDITTDSIFQATDIANGYWLVKEEGVVAGMDVATSLFTYLDPSIHIEWLAREGDFVPKDFILGRISGPVIPILKGERLTLNLMQHLSGIATMSHQFANLVAPYSAKVVDTRKTLPGLRELEKRAVWLGGCYNHRRNLSESVLIKDNHIQALGGIAKVMEHIKRRIPHTMKIEIEVDNIEDFRVAKEYGADIVLLDNMHPDDMKVIVEENQHEIILEASGNVTLDNLENVAQSGVDYISVGALTHSAKALDMSLKLI